MSSMKHPIPMASMTASFSSASSSEDDQCLQESFVDTPFVDTADIYGQVHPVESKRLLEQRLAEFDDHLRMVSCEGTILNAAMVNYSTLFCKQTFRLQFLRSECFRVKVSDQTSNP